MSFSELSYLKAVERIELLEKMIEILNRDREDIWAFLSAFNDERIQINNKLTDLEKELVRK